MTNVKFQTENGTPHPILDLLTIEPPILKRPKWKTNNRIPIAIEAFKHLL
jgi:hypothetical protein